MQDHVSVTMRPSDLMHEVLGHFRIGFEILSAEQKREVARRVAKEFPTYFVSVGRYDILIEKSKQAEVGK